MHLPVACMLLLSMSGVMSCMIQNFRSGVCMDYAEYKDQMPFCGQPFKSPGLEGGQRDAIVTYRACVPKLNQLFPKHTIAQKDLWIQRKFLTIVEERIHWERDEAMREKEMIWLEDETKRNSDGKEVQVMKVAEGETVTIRFWNEEDEDPRGKGDGWRKIGEKNLERDKLMNAGVHEAPPGFGEQGTLYDNEESLYYSIDPADPEAERIYDFSVNTPYISGEEKISDCELAYRNYFCYMNFPRCNAEDESLVLCKSVCENLMRACGFSMDMNRCGPSEFFNGYEPESPSLNVTEGIYNIYYRDFFPGQPFRENAFDALNDPVVVCTPSNGWGNRAAEMSMYGIFLLMVFVQALLFWA